MKYFNKQKLKNPNGFTLAEVLITLVIIGIIAAMTIPAVINTYVESSTVSKVKKAMSTLGQAKILAETQNGPIQDWNFDSGLSITSTTQLWSYLKPYIQIAKDCRTNSSECYNVSKMYYLNGTETGNLFASHVVFVLSDGSVMCVRTALSGRCSATDGGVPNACAAFYYDVNGAQPPNTVGRDVFSYVMSTDGVYPSLSNGCNKNSTGWGCTAYIMKTGNMNYLH